MSWDCYHSSTGPFTSPNFWMPPHNPSSSPSALVAEPCRGFVAPLAPPPGCHRPTVRGDQGLMALVSPGRLLGSRALGQGQCWRAFCKGYPYMRKKKGKLLTAIHFSSPTAILRAVEQRGSNGHDGDAPDKAVGVSAPRRKRHALSAHKESGKILSS